MCKSTKKITKIRKHLSTNSAETFVHALVTCYMVYLITFWSDCKRSRMRQQVLSPDSDTQTGSHLWTPFLFKLHWLPIKGRIVYYKILLLYKALNGLAPPYITDLIYLRVILDPRRIRNWKYHIIIYCSYGYRSFSVSAWSLWNSLLKDIRLYETLDCF